VESFIAPLSWAGKDHRCFGILVCLPLAGNSRNFDFRITPTTVQMCWIKAFSDFAWQEVGVAQRNEIFIGVVSGRTPFLAWILPALGNFSLCDHPHRFQARAGDRFQPFSNNANKHDRKQEHFGYFPQGHF
jgi:hypothetical protein